jgi:hypothetical protein
MAMIVGAGAIAPAAALWADRAQNAAAPRGAARRRFPRPSVGREMISPAL